MGMMYRWEGLGLVVITGLILGWGLVRLLPRRSFYPSVYLLLKRERSKGESAIPRASGLRWYYFAKSKVRVKSPESESVSVRSDPGVKGAGVGLGGCRCVGGSFIKLLLLYLIL